MKERIRVEMKKLRMNIDLGLVQKKSEAIYEKLVNSDLYKKSSLIMSYKNFKNEVDTAKINSKILFDNKELILPRVENNNIVPVMINEKTYYKKSKFGINEPMGNNYKQKIDLVIVPGVAFDIKGHRIGFGGGYYDRFLKNNNAAKCAICYEFQIVKEIKKDEFDVDMDFIITEDRIIEILNWRNNG